MSKIRALVVDDEPMARDRVLALLQHEEDVEVVGECGDGTQAVTAIHNQAPDLVFLDVQMPGHNGFEVIEAVGADRMPTVIFVTAYDEYALQAFDVAAVDYLVKPFDDDRFEQAFRRARRQLELEGMGRLRQQLLSVLGAAPSTAPGTEHVDDVNGSRHVAENAAGSRYLERIAVETRGKLRVVQVSQIDYITASGPYAELHVADRVHLIRESMQTLEERLDPAVFLRIHRSAIVKLELVETLLREPGGDYEVQLRGGARLRVSRSRREELERKLGISS